METRPAVYERARRKPTDPLVRIAEGKLDLRDVQQTIEMIDEVLGTMGRAHDELVATRAILSKAWDRLGEVLYDVERVVSDEQLEDTPITRIVRSLGHLQGPERRHVTAVIDLDLRDQELGAAAVVAPDSGGNLAVLYDPLASDAVELLERVELTLPFPVLRS